MHTQDHTGDGHQDAVKSVAWLALWTLAWTMSIALAKFGSESLWDSRALSWVAVAVNVGAGIGWIVAHARYLRSIDELQRKIMQDALAVTLGVGWVGGFAYVIAHGADLIVRNAEIGVFAMFLALVYLVAIAAGHLRYR